MSRQFFLTIALIFVSACSDAGAEHGVSRDHEKIVRAVLIAQPDVATQHREFVAEYPDEASWLDRFLDFRLCVARETAGTDDDFERTEWEAGDPPPDFAIYSDRWEESPSRQNIPGDVLPEHLRWDAALSFCPSGVLRIGNPIIQGDRSVVYVENSSSVHGWAGEIELIRDGDEWIVQEERNWWQT